MFPLILIALLFGHPHYACLKPDGDWLHGVSKKQCYKLGGRWMVQQ